MENSNTDPQTQDPPATEISEPMVEAAARAIYETMPEPGFGWSQAQWYTRARCIECARAALIAGIAAALEERR